MAEYTVIIEHDPVTGLYCGQCQQLPEAISQGSTEEELMANIREAIELVLEDRGSVAQRHCRTYCACHLQAAWHSSCEVQLTQM
ncbi:MAG: type II toxin-antitoxin system HicB family antitoxin [Bacteroidaceae bacterium]|nr:type II toxin-antitoxin system HicB family antitoxin [Bacteroidaceae bacterium]